MLYKKETSLSFVLKEAVFIYLRVKLKTKKSCLVECTVHYTMGSQVVSVSRKEAGLLLLIMKAILYIMLPTVDNMRVTYGGC